MKIVNSVKELRELLSSQNSIGFVPTMGALHSGHIELVRRAVSQNTVVVVSVFVNPTQFNDKADLERYPRTLERDAELLHCAGATYLFAPSVEEIYPNNETFTIKDSRLLSLTEQMEGAHRPGHFDGVVQVVGRLFDIVGAHRAYFGQKDFQQLAIIKMMVEIEGYGVEIVECPTVRAEDGLALSSRNELLTAEQRAAAPEIFRTLTAIRAEIERGNRNFKQLEDIAISQINKNTYLCTEYVEIVDARTLLPPSQSATVRICTAVQCGSVRLIDNL